MQSDDEIVLFNDDNFTIINKQMKQIDDYFQDVAFSMGFKA